MGATRAPPDRVMQCARDTLKNGGNLLGWLTIKCWKKEARGTTAVTETNGQNKHLRGRSLAMEDHKEEGG